MTLTERVRNSIPPQPNLRRVSLRTKLVASVLILVFAALALISLPDNWHSKKDLILWVSSSFLQLVLLPIIIVGQNIQAKAADKRSEATYNDAVAVLQEAKQIQEHLMAQDEVLQRIIAHLDVAHT